MKYKIPKDIFVRLTSAESLLVDADSLPNAFIHNATRYFLYIKAWELYKIANAKLEAWIDISELDPKLLKDHSYKLENSPTIQRIYMMDSKVATDNYKSGKAKNKLLQELIYGRDDKSRSDIFLKGWFYSEFRLELESSIRLMKIIMNAIENLDEK